MYIVSKQHCMSLTQFITRETIPSFGMKNVVKIVKSQIILVKNGVSFAIGNGHGCTDMPICQKQNVSQIQCLLIHRNGSNKCRNVRKTLCNFKDKTATTQISFIGKQATSFSTADRPILKTHVPFHQVKPAQVSGDQQKTSRITAVCCGATTSSYYFWDPAGLSSGGSVENFKRRRQTELKHGRISMLATTSPGVKSDCQPQSGTPVNSPTTTFYTEDGVLGPRAREVRLAKGGGHASTDVAVVMNFSL